MILGAVWMAVANAAVVLAARATLRRARTGRPSTDLVLFLILRLAFIMALVAAAGLLGVLSPAGVGIPCAVLLVALLLRGERFDIPWRIELPRDVSRLAAALAAFIVLRSLLQVWFYSPLDGDATSYHLPKVADWIRVGGFRVDLGNDPRAWFPAGFELVETWWALFLHHEALIETAGLEFLLLAAAAAASLAGWLGLPPRAAFLAGLLVASTPGFSMQSVACLNDGPAAALVLAGAALIAAGAPFPLLVLLGGMAAGLKPTTAFALPGLLLLLWLLRKEPRPPPGSRPGLAALALLGLALGAFWYLRTWIAKGSPLYPVGSADILHPGDGRSLQRAGPNVVSLLNSLAALADQRLYDGRRPYDPLLEYAAGWGPAIVACGLPAWLAALRSDARLRALSIAFGVSLLSVLSLVVYDACNLRFVLWFAALPALGLAWAIERAPRLLLPTLAAVVVACLGTTFTNPYSWPQLRHHLLQDPLRVGGSWVLPVQPGATRVGAYGRYTSRDSTLRGPDFRREVIALRAATPEELRDEMRRHGLKLLYALYLARQSRENAVLEECVRRSWLKPLATGVYALP